MNSKQCVLFLRRGGLNRSRCLANGYSCSTHTLMATTQSSFYPNHPANHTPFHPPRSAFYTTTKTAMTMGSRHNVRSTGVSWASSSSCFETRHSLSTTTTSEPQDNNVWEQMNEKTRTLANDLLLQIDDSDPSIANDERKKLRFRRRTALARSITLIESSSPIHQKQANLLLTYLTTTANTNASTTTAANPNFFRLGIAGSPGAGKSTFIEAFGQYLLNHNQMPQEHKNKIEKQKKDEEYKNNKSFLPNQLAVICIDPSSSLTGGSILGDKTRMNEISRHERAFVRPAPTQGNLGGLSTYTDDMISLCKVANYDFVIVETVGLGQSEIEVAQSVDYLLLLIPPGGGDDLQGVKKGILEVADCICITKSEGELLSTAKRTANDYKAAMTFFNNSNQQHLLRLLKKRKQKQRLLDGAEEEEEDAANTVPQDNKTPIHLISSYTGKGFEDVWNEICKYRKSKTQTKELDFKRQEQAKYWMWKNLRQLILLQTKNIKDPELQIKIQELEDSLFVGKITPRVAAKQLFNILLLDNSKME